MNNWISPARLHSPSRPAWLAPAALLAAAGLAVSCDCRLAAWCLRVDVPGEVRKLLQVGELFGHGLGVLLAAALIHQLDGRRWAVSRLLVCALGAGLAADVIKMTIARTRPHHHDLATGAWASFTTWLPLTSEGSVGQSFPSAHVATCVGMCVALTWLYPRGKVLFAVLAVLTACARIQAGAHYLSDVFCGAAVGLLVARWLLKNLDALNGQQEAPEGRQPELWDASDKQAA